MKRILLLSFCSLLLHAQETDSAKPIRMGGWFDFTKTASYARVLALASNERLMAVASIGAGPATEITVYNSEFVAISRWRSVKAPRYLAVTDSSIVLTHFASKSSSFSACIHQIDGTPVAPCLTVDGWPINVVAAGISVYAMKADGIDQLDFLNRRSIALPGVTNIGSDPSVATVAGSRLIRVNTVTLNGSSFDLPTNSDTPLTFLSPRLSINRETRGVREMLVATAVGRNLELLLMNGRQSIYTGIPIDRFDASSGYGSTVLLETPQFDELKRVASPMPLMSNPTGHMVADHLAVLGNRLLIVDATALRCAWFDLQRP